MYLLGMQEEERSRWASETTQSQCGIFFCFSISTYSTVHIYTAEGQPRGTAKPWLDLENAGCIRPEADKESKIKEGQKKIRLKKRFEPKVRHRTVWHAGMRTHRKP